MLSEARAVAAAEGDERLAERRFLASRSEGSRLMPDPSP